MSLLGIQSGERRVLMPALALAFASVGAFALSTIASDTLFVSAFDLAAVSRFYLVATLARGSFALLYGAAASRMTLPVLDAVVLAITAAVMVAAGVVVPHASKTVVYGVCALLAFSPSLLPLVAFNTASACFHPRQAKRLIPLVGAAGTVGCIAVGAGARVLAQPLGIGSLLIGGGLLCAAAIPVVPLLARAAPPASTEGTAADRSPRSRFLGLADALRDARETPVVRLFLLHALLGGFAAVVVDFGFKAALKERYQHEQMAAFLGSFSVASNALILVVQLFVTQRVMARFGVPGALKTLPASLVAVGAFVALAPSLVSATSAKLVESVARLSLGGAVSDLLLLPTVPRIRARAKAIARGVVVPLATVLAFAALAPLGRAGVSAWVIGVLLLFAGALGSLAVSRARQAYVSALARALGDRQISQEVVRQAAVLGPFLPAAIASLRAEARRLLGRALASNDEQQSLQVVALMADPMFSPADIAPALESTSVAVRRAAVEAACQIARFGEGDRLLAAIAPKADPDLEELVILRARQLGSEPPDDRVARLLAALAPSTEPARRSILSGLDAPAAELVAQLTHGPRVLSAADALALAGPRQIDSLVDALPKGGAGTARAAHVLAAAGPYAHARVFERFSELGYRGRNAVIRSFAMTHARTRSRHLEARAPALIESLLAEAEGLFTKHGNATGLLGHEVRHRIGELTSRVLDLTSFGHAKESIARARWALAQHDHARGQALELIENLLPQGVARRLVAILEDQPKASSRPSLAPRDAWLQCCHRYDAGMLSLDDPMLTVLERVAILQKAPIFGELSAEELYRVGEIASEVLFAPGETIVRQGDPADALFVVMAGTLEVQKNDSKIRELGSGAAFGEVALLDGGPRAATVLAQSEGRLLKIPGDEFHVLLDHTPELSRGVIRVLLAYVRGSSDPTAFGDR